MHLHRLAALLTATVALAACGGSDGGAAATSGTSDGAASGAAPLEVTVGFYPYQFVTERVGGDDVTVTNLTKPGGEPHDLELTPQQVARLGETDLVVYSRGFQPAVDVAVDQQAADRSFDVLTAVELREHEDDDHADEEQAKDDGHGHDDEHADEEAGEEAGEAHAGEGEDDHAHDGEDPHVWLDPMRLSTIAGAVADQLSEIAPDRAEGFRTRAQELQGELAELDEELRQGLASCERKEIVTSHDAFGYLAEAYGLEQVAIAGLSPDDEASPRRLAEVADFAKENGVTTIFFEELVSPKVAETLAREVGAEATVLSPLEGPPAEGDYLSAMRENLERLQAALGCS